MGLLLELHKFKKKVTFVSVTYTISKLIYMKSLSTSLFLFFSFIAGSQTILTNGVNITESGGAPSNCGTNGFKTVNAANETGTCIELTSGGFANGAVWVCDPIDLDFSFRIQFDVNFGTDINGGDGMAFLLQNEGVPQVIGGRGGGLGYATGDGANCQGGACPIEPSVAVEFDTWDGTTFGDNDIACNHMSIQTDGVTAASNTILQPVCLLPSGTSVVDGQNHSVCISWDPSTFKYEIQFDGTLIATYNGDIRNFFTNPNVVWWGFTGATGGVAQTQSVCNVFMQTNLASPSCCSAPDPSFTLSDFCEGSTNSASNIVTSGGTFSFNPDPLDGATINPSTGEITNGVGGTSYNVQYLVGTSCPDSMVQTVNVLSPDDASFNYPQNNYCTDDADPLPTINGLAGGQFSIDNGGVINTNDGTIDISGTPPGSYTITYTTNGPCPNSSSFSLSIGSAADATISTVSALCSNDAPITLTASNSGGVWSGTGISNSSTGVFDPALAGVGSHTITYTISGTCGDVDTEIIQVLALDDASFAYANAGECEDNLNPLPNITGIGGGVFSIDNGGSISSSTGEIDLVASGNGLYQVTYTTSGACPNSSTQSFNIFSTPSALLDSSNNVLCFGDMNGQIYISATGGNVANNYQYDWDADGFGDNDDTEDLTGIAAGSYQVIVTDDNGCDDTLGIVITEPSSLQLTVDAQNNPSTCGVSDGEVLVSASGGTQPYLFDWDNDGVGDFDDTEDLNNLGAGTYILEVMDANGCTESISASISDPSAPVITIDSTINVSCFGESTGAIYTTITGGSGNLTISWNNGQSTEDISSLSTGTYDLTVTDAVGCVGTAAATINGPSSALGVNATPADEIVGSDGSIDLSVTGGTPPYNYDWDVDGTGDFDDTEDLSGLSTGTYIVWVEDANGCSDSLSVFVGSQVGIEDEYQNRFKIYPNPTSGVIQIETSLNSTYHVKLYSMQGKLVLDKAQAKNNQAIELQHLPKGVYMLNLVFENRIYSSKVILE